MLPRALPPLAASLAAALIVSLTAGGVAAPAAAATPATGGATDIDVTPSMGAIAGDKGPARSNADLGGGRYIVSLVGSPVAGYRGGIAEFRATADEWDGDSAESRAAQSYADFLVQTQEAVAETVGAQSVTNYTIASNAFVAVLTAEQAQTLSADPRVSGLVEDTIVPLAYQTSTAFLGLEGDGGVWSQLGGTDDLGEGVVVGVIDTGIAPENPSFAGQPLGDEPGDAPWREGDTVLFDKTDGSRFRGECETGVQFETVDCSTKIVGARYFVEGFQPQRIGDPGAGEYLSPRDGNGHGSHTASTAAGNAGVLAEGNRISGVTPGAKISVYKACWSGPDPQSSTDDGCATSDLLAAIDAATKDGVDVINYSIGGDGADTTVSVTDQAFLVAANAGIFVAAAAGNAGPAASTLDNAAPWITTVAASTIEAPAATLVLGDGTRELGTSSTVPTAGLTGRLVLSDAVAIPNREAGAALCVPDSLDPELVAGTIVVCDRGEIARTLKADAVRQAGGIGMVLVNPTPSSLDVDVHTVPTIHVDAVFRDKLRSYVTTADEPAATFVLGNPENLPVPTTPQVAAFSSRGPVQADTRDIMKPDVAAPGTTILAALGNPDGGDPTFGYASGTSMASPHVAGMAALYLSQHPSAAPSEIKSALMTTARDTVTETGDAATDPFAQGAGQIDAAAFLNPGLVLRNGPQDWLGYIRSISGDPTAPDPSDLNLPSIQIGSFAGTQTVTRTLTATAPGTYTASMEGLAGIEATIEPRTLNFAEAGQQEQVRITFTRTTATIGKFATGFVKWLGSDGDVRVPVAITPIGFDATPAVRGEGNTGSVQITTNFGEDATYEIHKGGLTRGSRVTGIVGSGSSSPLYAVDVAEGAELLQIELRGVDGADVNLNFYQRGPEDGLLYLVGESQSPSITETITIDAPMPGAYVAEVSTPPGAPDAGYSLASFVLDVENPTHEFTITPAQLTGATGSTPTVGVEWSNLPGGEYLGAVGYGDTGVATLVTIDAGATTPTDATPNMRIQPTEEEWLLTGAPVRITASGLTPGEYYTVDLDDMREIHTGTANEDGRADWFVPTPSDLEPGTHTLRLRGAGVAIEQVFRSTPILIFGNEQAELSYTFDGAPMVEYLYQASGEGQVRVQTTNTTTGSVESDEIVPVELGLFLQRTGRLAVGPGELQTTATVLFPDGSTGPVYTFSPIIAVPGEASSFAVTAVDNDGTAHIRFDNRTGEGIRATVEYFGCDGTRVVADDWYETGETLETWNLAGVSAVRVTSVEGEALLSYRHSGPSSCDELARQRTGQDTWATITLGSDAQRPLHIDLGYRYEPGITGFTVDAGEGLPRQEPFFNELVPVSWSTERGAVAYTDFDTRENVPTWVVIGYGTEGLDVNVTGQIHLPIPSLTVQDLQPWDGTLMPGLPTLHGEPRAGETVSIRPGSWSPSEVTFTYQWSLNGVTIEGATSDTLTLPGDSGGQSLVATVIGTAPTGESAAASTAAVTVLHGTSHTNPGNGPAGIPNRDDNPLASTGATVAYGIIALAVLLIVSGALLAHVRRRGRTLAESAPPSN